MHNSGLTTLIQYQDADIKKIYLTVRGRPDINSWNELLRFYLVGYQKTTSEYSSLTFEIFMSNGVKVVEAIKLHKLEDVVLLLKTLQIKTETQPIEIASNSERLKL